MKIVLKPNKHDIFIGSFLLAFLIALIISLLTLKSSSDHYVYIKYDGQVVHTMDLNVDEVYVLNKSQYSDLQENFEITVKDGEVFISKNKCPEEFCKHLGAISTKGQALVCAPNKVVIEIGEKIESDCDWGVCADED